MTHDEMIAVIQAHKEGKTVQAAKQGCDWSDCVSYHLFNFSVFNYRIKPEPLVCWVNVYPDGAVVLFNEKRQAEAVAEIYETKRKAVKMVEADESN